MLSNDLSYVGRLLRRSAGFSVAAVVTLALGIGATTAVFSVLDAVVLRPLPYEQPDRLVRLESRVPGIGIDEAWNLSQAGFFFLRRESRTFEEIGAVSGREMNLSDGEVAERAYTVYATAGMMSVLRATPVLGRLITPADDAPDGPDVAVLGHGFWMSHYGGRRDVVGQVVRVEGRPREIIGVMAEGINLPDRRVDIWLPYGLDPHAPAVNAHHVPAIGRLTAGTSLEQAQRDLDRMTALFAEAFPEAYEPDWMAESEFATRAIPLRDYILGDSARRLWIVFAAVGLVLLISCANVANLFLVRAEARRREISIRHALGATRRRLVQLFLTESIVLTLMAGLLGIALSHFGVKLLTTIAPTSLPRLSDVAVNGTTVSFTLAVSVLVALTVGMFPILRYRAGLSHAAFADGSPGVSGGRRHHAVHNALVIGQVALALTLLVSAGLMLRTFQRFRAVNPGFDPSGIVAFRVSLPTVEYPSPEEVAGFYERLRNRLEELPLVSSVGMIHRLPLKDGMGCFNFYVEDRPIRTGENAPCLPVRFAAPAFFQTMKVRMVEGREFEPVDNEHRTGTVILSRALADRLWPGQSAIGRGVSLFSADPPFYRVIGVADDIHDESLDKPPSETAYFPLLAIPDKASWGGAIRSMRVVIRTEHANPIALAAEIRRVVSELDPDIPIADLETMQQIVRQSMARVSMMMLLLGTAAVMALVIGSVGLYAVIAYLVSRQQTEIAVRMALGANRATVVGMVVRRSTLLAMCGIALGLIGALLFGRVLQSLLFGVSSSDPVLLGGVAALLLTLSVFASLVPAWRAAAVPPGTSLRAD